MDFNVTQSLQMIGVRDDNLDTDVLHDSFVSYDNLWPEYFILGFKADKKF